MHEKDVHLDLRETVARERTSQPRQLPWIRLKADPRANLSAMSVLGSDSRSSCGRRWTIHAGPGPLSGQRPENSAKLGS